MAKAPYRIRTDKSWSATNQELRRCFDQWGVHEWAVEANVPRQRSASWNLTKLEAAVTVVFTKDGRQIVLSLDTQSRPVDNLRALYLCLEDMRMLDARGLAQTAQSAYMQLAAPKAERDPYEVLGLRPGATAEEINGIWRIKSRSAHPDAGGSNEAMAELNAARDALLARIGAS